MFLGIAFKAILELGAHRRYEPFFDDHPKFGNGMNCGYLGLDRLGEFDAALHGTVRELRAVCRQQNMLEHDNLP
ncbi:hypothetical protein D3C83_175180 [compost metagenome]